MADRITIEQLKKLFESISCLCAEGPEVFEALKIIEAIQKETTKGYKICERYLYEEKEILFPPW